MALVDRVKAIPQRAAQRKLAKQVLRDYADDPKVEFHKFAPIQQNAEHGMNVTHQKEVTDA